jgi:hypothetical protein
VNRSFLSSPAWLPKALPLFAVAAVCALAAGCGGGSSPSTQIGKVVTEKRNCAGSKIAAKREQQRRRLNADLVQLRRAAATVNGHTENGNAALDKALDRFSLDVGNEALSVHERSDYINHAAAIVAPKCYLCFQTLESNRPIAAGAKLPCD